jgi:signal transduction histidine kinase
MADQSGGRKRGRWTGIGVTVLAVVVVVLAFVATTSLFLVRSRGIDAAAEQLTSNAVPSLQELIATRSTAERLRLRVGDVVHQRAGDSEAHARVWRAVSELRQHLSRYVGLPSYPPERRLWGELLIGVEAYIDAVGRVLEARARGDAPGALRLLETELEPAASRVEALLAESEVINVGAVDTFAEEMESIRVSARRDLLILNGLCVVLAAILLTWAVRSARHTRRVQERYLQASQERAREMEIFAGRVAHDILSPLGSASLALELLARNDAPEVQRTATRGLGGVARVRATVDGLLEFAQAGARATPDAAPTDLVEVAEEVTSGLHDAATAAGISLRLSTDRPELTVSANRGVVLSILTNLVQNAIKYIGEGPEKRVAVAIHEDGPSVRVDVSDTGPGVPPHLEQLVFEPYFRARAQLAGGLGLGLATVKRLVEAHGGHVGVRSALGQGSTFWFDLPGAVPVRHAPPDRSC